MTDQMTVRWKRVSVSVGVGLIVAMALLTAIDAWKKQDGWCIRFYPDGSEKTLYGSECNFPKGN